jgi:peptide/nickel transport system ATP-binding protein
MIFQDPYSSLNPRMSVGDAIEEAIAAHFDIGPRERRQEAMRLLAQVGLSAADRELYPFQFSGGQRQRIAIARALAVRPQLIIADEVTSALDVLVQSTILNLLRALQDATGVSLLFISHNLAVVRYLAESICVMHLGKVVEMGSTVEIFRQPRHPYTRALIDAVPQIHVGAGSPRIRLQGDLPDPHHPPAGCSFHTRCPIGPLRNPERDVCRTVDPHKDAASRPHHVACHFALGFEGPANQEQPALNLPQRKRPSR